MTPVIALAIDSRTPAFLSSPSFYLLYPIYSVSNFHVHVTAVVVRVVVWLITPECAQSHKDLARIVDVTQVSNLVLSFLTNVLATSIIAIKSWCILAILYPTCVLKGISQGLDNL